MHTQTLVIGAGFAGLAAAARLQEHGIAVHVVEARDRVGGRTHTQRSVGGIQIDLGGQWFGPTQTRMYELVDEHGVELFPLQEHGRAFVRVDGAELDDAPPAVADLLDLVDDAAAAVDLDDPASTPDAAALDAVTLHTWLGERAEAPVARYVGRVLAGGLLAKDAGEVSALQVLFYVRSGSGTRSLLGTVGGAQQDRVVGGPFALAERLAAGLGDVISHGFVVERLVRGTEGWTASARDGRQVTAERVICAIPAPLVPRIGIEPALPPHRRRALAALVPGNALKVHAVYPAPYWREQGLSGVFNSADGLVTEAVDNSVPGHDEGVLTFFVYGEESATVARMAPQERRAVLLDELAERLREPRLREPLDLVDFSWDTEPFTEGCFSSTFAVGTMHRYAATIREPWEGIHFAGTETAAVWNGYIEGAVRSGERAADEVAGARASRG